MTFSVGGSAIHAMRQVVYGYRFPIIAANDRDHVRW